MIRLSDLPEKSRAELLRRIAALGLSPKLWPQISEPPNSFHREGVGWGVGEFLYREDAQVHGLTHEVGHLAQLSPQSWKALAVNDPGTSENIALLVQVEISRGLPGLGIRRMLQEMQAMDYAFDDNGDECDALRWWQTVPYQMSREWTEAKAIAERWKKPRNG